MKKLLAYNINGQTVGIDLQSWEETDLNGNPPFKVIKSEWEIPTGYVDISSIINWHKFGFDNCNDYLCSKNEIKELIETIGWNNLSNEEKDLGITYYSYITPMNAVIYLMSKGYSQQQAQLYLIQEWHKHHANVLLACQQRWYYVKLVIAAFLNFTDAEDLFDINESLIFAYTNMGRLGINYEDQKDGIMDFIESTNTYLNNGLRESGYVLLQGNYDTFIQAIHDVLVHGYYTKY